jgi:hypothetical protein
MLPAITVDTAHLRGIRSASIRFPIDLINAHHHSRFSRYSATSYLNRIDTPPVLRQSGNYSVHLLNSTELQMLLTLV